ncbi:ABC transporter permease [Clostridium cadaveris]|uniref:ABC transporter permease n=1 Tax=Clostridium cadaveris TaxID=1529 RepID=UPI000C072938|nr:ABC transporter permease [Clostridium cadaveris]
MRENLIVIRARFIRSMKNYFRYPLNFILSLFNPIIWLAPYYFMGKAFEQGGEVLGFASYTGNSDYMGFMIVGYIVTSYFSTALWSTGFTLKNEMMQGTLESNWSTPANRMAMILGSVSFQFCATTFEMILTLIICHFLFNFTVGGNILLILAFFIPGIIALVGLGIAVSSAVLLAKEANAVIDLSSSIFQGLSGGFFPVKILPNVFLFISLLLPLTYLNDGMRAIMIGQTPIISLKSEFVLIIISMFVFYLGGRYIFMRVERLCRDKGLLSGH